MRITFLTHFPGQGGSTVLLRQLKSFFESRGHAISVVVGEDSESTLIPDYQVVPDSSPPGSRDRLRLYVQCVQRTKPDMVYTISGTEESNVLRFLCVPRVLHVFSLEQHEYLDVPFRLGQLEAYTEGRTANTPDVLPRICPANGAVLQAFTAPYRLDPCFAVPPTHDYPHCGQAKRAFQGRLARVLASKQARSCMEARKSENAKSGSKRRIESGSTGKRVPSASRFRPFALSRSLRS